MRTYQLVLVLRSDLAESPRKKLLDSVKEWLKEAKITKEDQWGQKPLGYKIKGENSGFYINYLIESENAIALDFEKRLLGSEGILRHLLLRTKIKGQMTKPKAKEKAKKEKKPSKK